MIHIRASGSAGLSRSLLAAVIRGKGYCIPLLFVFFGATHGNIVMRTGPNRVQTYFCHLWGALAPLSDAMICHKTPYLKTWHSQFPIPR
ncbi:hypothetical protein B0O99DRAFT_633666 [Bisporella sp. PMI_857]|nr:hypothetical protein B0O99DRAFT_633666 [Bisporella sp. PMI_857]